MSANTAMLLSLLLPCTGALMVALTGRWPNVRDSVTMAISVATAGVVATLVAAVSAGERPGFVVGEMFEGAPIAFSLEPLGSVYAMVAAGLWIVTSLYAIGYMRGHHEKHQTRFFVCFALAIAASLGIAFSRNLLTLFLFYELLTFSTYPLVTHHQTHAARNAGRIYLGVLVSTSVGFLLFAVLWTWHLAGSLEFVSGGLLNRTVDDSVLPILLALFAFGTGKAALMPVHRWLPAAMVAPTPVSALLHAVAVVKAGVFTILKVVVYIFGIERLSSVGASQWLMAVAGITIVSASCIAIRQDNLKKRLAYSTISQLSYIVLGAALASSASIVGGAMHIAMHAMAKITLFFCAGAIYVAAHKTKVSELNGLGRKMPFTMVAFAIASLSLIGVPPLGGMWSKWYLVLGAIEGGNPLYVWVLMLSSLLSIGYLMPVVVRAFFVAGDTDDSPGLKEAPWQCVLPLCLTAAGCVLLFFLAEPVYRLIKPVVGIHL